MTQFLTILDENNVTNAMSRDESIESVLHRWTTWRRLLPSLLIVACMCVCVAGAALLTRRAALLGSGHGYGGGGGGSKRRHIFRLDAANSFEDDSLDSFDARYNNTVRNKAYR